MMKVLLSLLFLVAAALPLPLRAEEAAAGDNTLSVSLQQCILLALEQNLDIRVERLKPAISAAQFVKEKAAFDPWATAEFATDQSLTPQASQLSGADVLDQDSIIGTAGIKTRLVTGGNLSLGVNSRRFATNSGFQRLSPQYTSDFSLTLVQPLLKDFGIGINQTRVLIAQNNLQISRHQFREKVTDTVSQVQTLYWDFVFARQDLDAKRHSLELARRLQDKTQALVQEGRLPPFASLQAESTAAQREVDVRLAENVLSDVHNRLKEILHLSNNRSLTLIPTDTPSSPEPTPTVEESIERALAHNPVLLEARLDVDSKKISERLARNQRFPDVSFVGSVGLNGLAGRANKDFAPFPVELGLPTVGLTRTGGLGNALDGLFSGGFPNWHLGLLVDIPLNRRAVQSDYLQAKLEAKKAAFSVQQLEEHIAMEVERFIRQLTASSTLQESARLARVLAEKTSASQEERLALGLATIQDVLEAQEDLAIAQGHELKAIIDSQKVLVGLDQLTGMTLERHHIEVKEDGLEDGLKTSS